MKRCECGNCDRCRFAERVVQANGSAKPKKPPKLRSLTCAKCAEKLELRLGRGRQRSLCDTCNAANRLENSRRQDAKRREDRKATKVTQ